MNAWDMTSPFCAFWIQNELLISCCYMLWSSFIPLHSRTIKSMKKHMKAKKHIKQFWFTDIQRQKRKRETHTDSLSLVLLSFYMKVCVCINSWISNFKQTQSIKWLYPISKLKYEPSNESFPLEMSHLFFSGKFILNFWSRAVVDLRF